MGWGSCGGGRWPRRGIKKCHFVCFVEHPVGTPLHTLCLACDSPRGQDTHVKRINPGAPHQLGDSMACRSSFHWRSFTSSESLRETTRRHLGSIPRKLCTRTGAPRPVDELWRERARAAIDKESLPTGAVDGSVEPEGSCHRPSNLAAVHDQVSPSMRAAWPSCKQEGAYSASNASRQM